MQISTINHPIELVESFGKSKTTFLELALKNDVSKSGL